MFVKSVRCSDYEQIKEKGEGRIKKKKVEKRNIVKWQRWGQ
jgi:hypothetical protein